ncbi:MAG: hypothetical protein H8E55_63060 [Pelagibacterales bacterium]|nr:hypothetical protein [Pelagibacterales bacterium]
MTEVEMFILLFISFITYMTGYTMGKDKGLKELANAIEMFPKEKTSIDALRKYYDFERTILIWNKFYKKKKKSTPKKRIEGIS